MTTIKRITEVCQMTGLAKSTIYKLIEDGKFPPPIKLTAKSSGWLTTELDDWLQNRIEFSRGIQP